MRLPNAVTAGADVLAGGALAGIAPGRLLPLVLAASLLYAGGCVLNGLCDRDGDRWRLPPRPLPSGEVSPREAGMVATFLLASGVATAGAAGPRAAVAATFLLALILLHDLCLKTGPVAGPAAMAGCRAAAVLLGLSPALSPPPAALLFPTATFLYVFALARMARHEMSEPPARPPVGAISLSFAGSILAALLGAALLTSFSFGSGCLFLLLFATCAIPGLGFGLCASTREDIPRGVVLLILAIPLLEAFAAGGAGGWVAGTAAAACALPAALTRRRSDAT
jgi:4-hydroxybenzoate polyprenyltransferase